MKRTIELDYVRSGQPRPYADRVNEVVITYSGDFGGDPTQEIVERDAKCLVVDYTKKKEDQRAYFESYLEEITKLGRGKWKIIIVEPYLD